MNKAERFMWESEQKFLIVAFLVGIPIIAGTIFFFKLLNPDPIIHLVFDDWINLALGSVLGGWIYAVSSWKAMIRENRKREGKM